MIVNTDHGFLLDEHDCLGKNFPPIYDELVHTPFFIHVPGIEGKNHTSQLASTVDIAPTLLDIFGCPSKKMGEMDGTSILPILTEEKEIRDMALFGVHGAYTCCTDGHMVYMKANKDETNSPIYEYTMMPTNIRGYFTDEQLKQAELIEGCRFTNGIPCLRMPSVLPYYHADRFGDRLYDLDEDPSQKKNLLTNETAVIWNQKLSDTLKKADAPKEEYERLGL